jgi:hypothetical protein
MDLDNEFLYGGSMYSYDMACIFVIGSMVIQVPKIMLDRIQVIVRCAATFRIEKSEQVSSANTALYVARIWSSFSSCLDYRTSAGL